jgi:hypothetical protein
MDPSSLVFVAIIGVWAAYLLPQWVRRRQHLAASRTLDRHSERTQLLEPRRRTVHHPSGPSSGRLHPTQPQEHMETVAAQSILPSSGRLAARRRARVLLALLLGVTGSWLAVGVGLVPGWAGLPGTALLVLDVLALRAAARRRAARAASRRRAPLPLAEPELVEAAEEPAAERLPYDDAAVSESLKLAAQAREPGTWDPIPVPPPLYTLKPAHHPGPPAEPARPAAVADPAAEAGHWSLETALERRRAVNG